MTRTSSWLQRWLGGQVPKLSSGDQVGSRPDTANLGFGQEAGLSDLPTAEFEKVAENSAEATHPGRSEKTRATEGTRAKESDR